MSLRRADARFLLARPPSRAAVVASLAGWEDALRETGVEVLPLQPRDTMLDLVVAPADRAAEAAALGAEAVILEGSDARRVLADYGYKTCRYVALPDPGDAEIVIPLDEARLARYASRNNLPVGSGWKALRNLAAGELMARGRALPGRPVTTVGVREPGPPFLVAGARELGVPPDVGWFATLGQRGDSRRRGAFFLFPSGTCEPHWVLKFSRLHGDVAPFDREERGMALAAAAGPAVSRRAPTLVGRLDVGGVPAAVETAAPGGRLDLFLGSRARRRAKIEAVEAVAKWTIELARSGAGSGSLAPRIQTLADEALVRWRSAEVSRVLGDRLAHTRPVLQHHDLGSYNVVLRDGEFTVLDWEGARADGFPLWDVLHFLCDALAQIDGAVDSPSRRDEHAVRLLRGELESSSVLSRWVTAAAVASRVEMAAIGALTTAMWLAVCGHFLEPDEPVPAQGSARNDALPASARIATLWLDTPGLGMDWSPRG